MAARMLPWLGIFYTHSPMTRSNAMDNLQAAAMTRAAQVATNRVKDQIRDEGRKLREFSTGELRRRVAALLANDPTIVEDAARWCSKFTTSAQKLRR